ncbi:hypothetical protein SEA_JEEVES_100 [Mycobacterium phage Jeeves]|uniref:DUF7273 domain-containing protein n=1 Tax=Mycobacterium phage Jeeves TaxID=2652402 RepID=A0A5J6T8J7_9CAUD|nr:hypothetical protein KNU75_gp009 [Mycobacterium phage Jeeves]QFG04575.1 hypothetical protein SEA_JEEVES_100 [Mycobacterium phage Jeeves]
MTGTEHDARDDIARELMTCSELLADEGNETDSRKAWLDAARVVNCEVSINVGIKLICRYENLLEGI